MFTLSRKPTPAVATVMVAELPPRPAIPAYALTPDPVAHASEEYMTEYARLAGQIGVMPPDLAIESFKAVLAKLNYPIFNMQEVIKYMDDKAAKESKEGAGWEWRPLREKDNRSMEFGQRCVRPDPRYIHSADDEKVRVPASDYYSGPARAKETWIGGGSAGLTIGQRTREFDKPADQGVYDRTIPLHAVRRIAAIEKEYTGDVCFFVSDYALLPAVQYPDPFLMAVIPNINVGNGTGRFVIDFWDEPGFGLDKMLK